MHALKVSNEILRLTARLTHIISSLLAQNASYKGEMSFEEASSGKYLLPQGGFLERNPREEEIQYFLLIVNVLLQESLKLYQRVSHLNKKNIKEKDFFLKTVPLG
jgi:hypothetical protein